MSKIYIVIWKIMIEVDVEAFKKEWFSFEDIQDIIESEREFEVTWVSYNLKDAFSLVRKNLFSNKNKKCIK